MRAIVLTSWFGDVGLGSVHILVFGVRARFGTNLPMVTPQAQIDTSETMEDDEAFHSSDPES